MEKKSGWVDKIINLTDENIKGRNLKRRKKEIKASYERIIDDFEYDIDNLENQIFNAQKDLTVSAPREETFEVTKSRIIEISKLQDKLEAKKAHLVKEKARYKEAFEDGNYSSSEED